MLVTLFALALISYIADTSYITRYRSNLALYSGLTVTHKSVLYSDIQANDWANLSDVASRGGLRKKGLICGFGTGAWLAHPGVSYTSGSNSTNYNTLLIGETCIPADNVESVQALSPRNKEPLGLITFTNTYFNARGIWLTPGTESIKDVNSFICPADYADEWTVEGTDASFCVIRPKEMISSGVCIMSDIPTQLSITNATVKHNCTPEARSAKSVTMQTCFSAYGAYKLHTNFLPLFQMKQICDDTADEGHKTGFFRIMDAWSYRVDKDRQGEFIPKGVDPFESDPNKDSKITVLEKFFEIFKLGCPLMDPIYYNLLRFMYLTHLKNGNKHDFTPGLSWETAASKMTECLKERNIGSPTTVKEIFSDGEKCLGRSVYDGFPPEEVAKKYMDHTADMFISGERFDQVIEQIWLMLSYVSPYCSTFTSPFDNFWTDFTDLFRRAFLVPVQDQWLAPGEWHTYYDYIFAGHPLERGRRHIISCVRYILNRTTKYFPIDRPSALVKEFVIKVDNRTTPNPLL